MENNAPVQASDHINSGRASSVQNGGLNNKSRFKKFKLKIPLLIVGGIFLILAGLFVSWLFSRSDSATTIDNGRYQAVYLVDNNVYFGKVEILSNGYLKLKDVFYVQATSSAANSDTQDPKDVPADQATTDIKLIKPGSELHAPDDVMIINKDQVLYIQNLKTDGKVSDAIIKYHQQQDKR